MHGPGAADAPRCGGADMPWCPAGIQAPQDLHISAFRALSFLAQEWPGMVQNSHSCDLQDGAGDRQTGRYNKVRWRLKNYKYIGESWKMSLLRWKEGEKGSQPAIPLTVVILFSIISLILTQVFKVENAVISTRMIKCLNMNRTLKAQGNIHCGTLQISGFSSFVLMGNWL